MVKNADKKRALLLTDLWRREIALQRGDSYAANDAGLWAVTALWELGGLMGVW